MSSPWDELEDNSCTEARVVVDAIHEAKANHLTEVRVQGFLSAESLARLREKSYIVTQGMGENGVETTIQFSGRVLPSATTTANRNKRANDGNAQSVAEKTRRVNVRLQEVRKASGGGDEVSAAYLNL